MIQVMKKHLANQDIIQHACKALGNFAFIPQNQITIAKAGGISVRIDALPCTLPQREIIPQSRDPSFFTFPIFLTLPIMSLGIR